MNTNRFGSAAPDFPVFKYKKDPSADVTINNGLHFHAVAVIPPETRLGMDFGKFIMQNSALYTGRNRYLSELHAISLDHDADYVTEYALKSARAGAAGMDEILLLPLSLSEMSSRTSYERKQAKIEGAKRRRYIPPTMG